MIGNKRFVIAISSFAVVAVVALVFLTHIRKHRRVPPLVRISEMTGLKLPPSTKVLFFDQSVFQEVDTGFAAIVRIDSADEPLFKSNNALVLQKGDNLASVLPPYSKWNPNHCRNVASAWIIRTGPRGEKLQGTITICYDEPQFVQVWITWTEDWPR